MMKLSAAHKDDWKNNSEYASLLMKDLSGESTELVNACRQGNIDFVQNIFDNGSVDQNTGRLALHFACWEDHIEVVRILLDNLLANDPDLLNEGCDGLLHFNDDNTPYTYAGTGGMPMR